MGRILPVNTADFLNIIRIEGKQRMAYGRQNVAEPRATVASGTDSTGDSAFALNIGKHAWIHGVSITTDRYMDYSVTIKTDHYTSTNSIFGTLAGSSTSASSVYLLPIEALVREGGSCQVFVNAEGGGEMPQVTTNIISTEFTADMNWNADRKILIIGDSTTWSTVGTDLGGTPYDGHDLYAFRLRDKINQFSTYTHRLINKGYGGSNAIDWKKSIRYGELDGINYDTIMIGLGMNDASSISGGYTIAMFKDNLQAIIDHRNIYNKGSKMLFIAPNLTDSASRTTNIAAIRTAISDVVTAAADTNIRFVNSSLAFSLNGTPAADANMTERTAGNRIHPSGAGHGLIADYIYAQHGAWLIS